MTIDLTNKKEFERFLQSNGIQRNSQDWKDYAKAKHLIVGYDFIEPELYEMVMRFVVNYLGL